MRSPYSNLYSFLPENGGRGPVSIDQLVAVVHSTEFATSPLTAHIRNVDCKSFEKVRRRLVHKFVLRLVYSVLHPLQLY
jgi:hypothetical protein